MNNDLKIGGILSIVSGILGILTAFMVVVFMIFFGFIVDQGSGFGNFPEEEMIIVLIVYGVMGLGLVLLGILGIIGGAFALKGKYWGLALAGAIAGIFTFLPTGVLAVVFIAKSGSTKLPQTPIPAAGNPNLPPN
jgi:hypothetical protein